ncbi:diguanylate cyclase/phosphodiesterase (GGDEF & EAL domains) with PAS/PAC sensor(s) [hydrothermal vent metagenome]|uniref:histidine kinase n=1 Tax=hydrothermal vent metagenome TaxID=652676 RepID=A0A3B0WTI8_9ZZZZ
MTNGIENYFDIVIVAFFLLVGIFSIWIYRLNNELKKTKKFDEQAIKENNDLLKFKRTLDKTLDGVFIFDAKSLKFTYVNEGAINQIGYSFSEIKNMHPYDIKPEYDEHEFRGLIKALMQDENMTLNLETIHQMKSGEILPVEIFMQYIESLGEAPIFIAIVRDISDRKKAEEKLLENKVLLETAQKISKVGHWKLNAETKVMSGSHEMFRIFGLTKEFSKLECFFDVLHQEDRAGVIEVVEKSMINGDSFDMEYRLIPNEKEKNRWVRAIGDAVKNKQGQVVELVGTVQDITEHKIKEQEIKESEDRFKQILETIPDAVLIIDTDNNIRFVNESFLNIFLYSKADVIGMGFDSLYVLSNDEENGMQFLDLNQGAYEFSYQRSDKNIFHGETTVTNLTSNKAYGQGQLVIIKDVSERRFVNQVLHSLASAGTGLEFKRFIDDVLKQLSELYRCEYAFIGQLQEGGKSIQTLSGYANGKIVDNYSYALMDTPCEDIISRKKTLIPENASQIYAKDQMLVDMGIEAYYGSPLIASDGKIIGLISVMSKSPLRLDSWVAPILGVFATRFSLELEREIASSKLQQHHQQLEMKVLERTKELSLARDEAEQASQIKSEFLSHMSHELRTPLNAILGFGQMLELDAVDLNADQRMSVQEILSAGRHLLVLINDVLDLAKIESGRFDVEMGDVEIKEILDECLSIVTIQAKTNNIEIINLIGEECYQVRANTVRLKQVLLNLLSNAVKYNSPAGMIALLSRKIGDDTLRICISDTGEGLTEKEMSQLFVAFDRLGVSSNIEGSGIGLLISKQMVEIMQGTMGVESIKGEGSTFWVEFKLV